jgi:hypothetical protein
VNTEAVAHLEEFVLPFGKSVKKSVKKSANQNDDSSERLFEVSHTFSIHTFTNTYVHGHVNACTWIVQENNLNKNLHCI